MNDKFFAFLAFSLMVVVAGCGPVRELPPCSATQKADISKDVPETDARVIIIRQHVQRLSGLSAYISLDHCLAGELADRSWLVIQTRPGKHEIRSEELSGTSKGEMAGAIQIELKPGETRYLAFNIKPGHLGGKYIEHWWGVEFREIYAHNPEALIRQLKEDQEKQQ